MPVDRPSCGTVLPVAPTHRAPCAFWDKGPKVLSKAVIDSKWDGNLITVKRMQSLIISFLFSFLCLFNYLFLPINNARQGTLYEPAGDYG